MAIVLETGQTTNFTGPSFEAFDPTIAYTPVNASTGDRLLMVTVFCYSNQVGSFTLTTPTYNGNAPISGGTQSSNNGSNVHDLVWIGLFDDADMPATTTSADFTCTITGAGSGPTGVCFIQEMTGVNQIDPVAEWDNTSNWSFGSNQQIFAPASPGAIQFIAVGSAASDYSWSSNDTAARSDYTYNNGGFRVNAAVFYATDGTPDATQSANNAEENWIGVALNAANAPTVASINGDNTAPVQLTLDQTGMAIVGTNLDDGTNSAKLTDTADVPGAVTQTNYTIDSGTGATWSSITRGNLPTNTAGRTVNFAHSTDSGLSAAFEVELLIEAGWNDVLVATPVINSASIYSIIESVHSITVANNDVCEWETNGGAVTIAANGVVTAPSVPQTFDVRYWHAASNTLYAAETITLVESGEVTSNDSIIGNVLSGSLDEILSRIFN